MILTAVDVKFSEQKDEMPPEVCRPLKKLKKNNVEKVGPQKVKKQTMSIKRVPRPPARPPARSPERGVRGAQLPGNVFQCFFNAFSMFLNAFSMLFQCFF